MTPACRSTFAALLVGVLVLDRRTEDGVENEHNLSFHVLP